MDFNISDIESSADRRRLERFRLAEPINGRLGSVPVKIIEIGLLGAGIELRESVEMARVLEFEVPAGTDKISIMARVVRIELDADLSEVVGETIYHAGLEFEAIPAKSAETLRDLVSGFVTEALSLQKANARGERSDWDRLSSLTAKKRPSDDTHPDLFIACRLLDDGTWQRSTILKPTQPRVGITVRADAPKEEVDLLCRTYASADHDGRTLIRLCAELSLIDETHVPPKVGL